MAMKTIVKISRVAAVAPITQTSKQVQITYRTLTEVTGGYGDIVQPNHNANYSVLKYTCISFRILFDLSIRCT